MTASIEQNLGHAYTQTLPTLGNSLGQMLTFFDVKRIYGVGGDFVANLINALSSHVAVLPSSNEMHAGFSACAQAELNPLGLCVTTYTVGSLPCMSAAALARTEGLPVVFISGAPGESEIHCDALHHTVHPHTAWHTDLNAALNAFKALGIRSERLQGQRHTGQPNVAAEHLFDLLSYAYINRQPVFIEIPRDLIFQPTQAIRLPAKLASLYAQPINLTGAELIAANIIDKLQNSHAPLIFIGEKLRLNRPLLQKIESFCHTHRLRYATSWFGKGMLNEDHELFLGCYNGIFSELAEQDYIENTADYILELGSAIFTSDTNNAFGSGTHKIDSHPNKTLIKGTSHWEKDIEAIINILCEQLPVKAISSLQDSVRALTPLLADAREAELGYHNLAMAINDAQRQLKKPYIFVPEVGNSLFASFELNTLSSDIGRSYLANPWYAAMGTSLPYARAIADQLAEQDSQQPVLVLTGDGGFNFQANELINLQKQDANVTIIYMRNNIFHLGKAGDAPIYHCNHNQFDPLLLIQAYGGHGYQCATVGHLIDTLTTTAAQGGLHLIEVPASIAADKQSDICTKLNTYIGFKNGDPSATKEWQRLCGIKANNATPVN